MAKGDTITVTGRTDHSGSWRGSGNNSGGRNHGSVIGHGGTMTITLGNGIVALVIGAHVINPKISGVPWFLDKNAPKNRKGNIRRSEPKYHSNIKNWAVDNSRIRHGKRRGSHDRPLIRGASDIKGSRAYLVSFGHDHYDVFYIAKKDSFSVYQSEMGRRTHYGKLEEQALAITKLYLLKDKEDELISRASDVIISSGIAISNQAGERYSILASEMANNIKKYQGKKVRSYSQAISMVNQMMLNPRLRLNSVDKKVVINALNQIKIADVADSFKMLGKAFILADRLLKARRIINGLIEGIEKDNWRPLVLEVEAMVLSGIAGAVAVGIITAMAMLTASLMAGVFIFGASILLTIIATLFISFIDADAADNLNQRVIRLIDNG